MTQADPVSERREKLEVSVRKATRADVAVLTGVLARAFDDDPMANWFVAQDGRRQERIATMQRVSLERISLPQGEVYTTERLHGAALWAPPGKWKMGLLQQLLLVPPMARATGVRHIPKVLGGINAIEKRHPTRPHYYLFVLGTEPEFQGRGVGTQLMQPVLERCDREGAPAYLESSKEKNVPLYERNGFRVTEVFRVPNGGPPLWLMWREPD
jgi:ribosomal protein S18 acetylase RimI-like enzyme